MSESEHTLEYCGRISNAALAAQTEFALPGDEPHYARDRLVDVQHIKLDIEIDPEAKSIQGTARTTFRPINDGVSHVEFDAVEMEIEDVRIQGRKTKATYSYDGNKLRIELGRGRKAGERITTVVRYSASPRRGLYFVAPDEGYPDKPLQVWSQGQDEDSRHWFPCVDFPNEMATSEMAVTVPKPMMAVSNGKLVSTSDRGRRRTFRWRQDQPHVAYLLSVAAGDFAEIRDRVDGVALQYYVKKGREADAKRALGRTPRMMKLFAELIGVKYPYAKYAQVVAADFIFGGMENVSATTLTENVLQDRRSHPDFKDAGDGLVAHELAHQWFGDLLTCRDWSHGWLNEGFATYFDALFTESDRGTDEFSLQMRQNGEAYIQADNSQYRRSIVSNVYNEPIDIFDRQLYEKGSCVLHMLRHQLGDALFWKAIRHYVAKHRGGNVTTPDLQRAIEESTGRNMDAFFEQWVYGAGHPSLTVSYEWDDKAKQAKLTVKQTQSADHGGREVFDTPVDVSFAVGRRNEDFRIQLNEREQSFYFPLSSRPKMVRFDPGGWLLKALKFKRTPELLTYQLKNDDDVLGRMDAARELGKLATKEAVAALKVAVQKDSFWAVQGAAARALGAAATPEALAALLDCVDVAHPRARRGVVAALGNFRDDVNGRGAEAAKALERVLLDGDRSYFVEAEAA
ncbi:MAG: HEAT repeat domain-containing protein, partial [Chloroflexi bacterium]|nr:HEAT repeat domain-containing protein [Chloroflexota bacterium]